MPYMGNPNPNPNPNPNRSGVLGVHAARGGGRHHGGVGGYGASARGGAARRARSNGTRGATEYAAGGAYGKNVATLDMALSPGEYTLYVTQPLPLPKEVHARLPCFAFDLEVSVQADGGTASGAAAGARGRGGSGSHEAGAAGGAAGAAGGECAAWPALPPTLDTVRFLRRDGAMHEAAEWRVPQAPHGDLYTPRLGLGLGLGLGLELASPSP